MDYFDFHFGFERTHDGGGTAVPFPFTVRLSQDTDLLGTTLSWSVVSGGAISQEFLRLTQGDTTHPLFEPSGPGSHRITSANAPSGFDIYAPFTAVIQYTQDGITTESNAVSVNVPAMPSVMVEVDTDGFDSSDRTIFNAILPAGYLNSATRDPDLAEAEWRISVTNPEGTFFRSETHEPFITDPNEPVFGEYSYMAESIVRGVNGVERTGAPFTGTFRIHHTNPLILMTSSDFFGVDFNWAPRQGATVSNVRLEEGTSPNLNLATQFHQGRTGSVRIQLPNNDTPQRVYGRLLYDDHNGNPVVGDIFTDIEPTLPNPTTRASDISYARQSRRLVVDSGLPAELFQLAAADPDIQSVVWSLGVTRASDREPFVEETGLTTPIYNVILNRGNRLARATQYNVAIQVTATSDTGRVLQTAIRNILYTTP